MNAAEASLSSPVVVMDEVDFQQIALFPPSAPPVRLNLHAHSALLAVMMPGCSPLTITCSCLLFRWIRERTVTWKRTRGDEKPGGCDGVNENQDVYVDL